MIDSIRWITDSVASADCRKVGITLTSAWIQICGPLVVKLDGERVEDLLPKRQGRLLFTYLALNRTRAVTRTELAEAIWADDVPSAGSSALNALLSKVRRCVPLEGRSMVQLALPAGAWVDWEVASAALHRAESAAAHRRHHEAWGPARVAQHITVRGFLPDETHPWVIAQRQATENMYLRALELAASAGLGIDGLELDTAERAARALVTHAPLRESGHRLLMEILARRGNRADALSVYEALRLRLRAELGVAPDERTQQLFRRLLG